MPKLAALAAVVLLAAGCGSSSASKPAQPPAPGPGQVIYRAAGWAVVLDGGKAAVQRLVAGTWRPDTSGAVKVTVLGPKPDSRGNPRTPQVAAELRATSPLAQSALWVDGVELLEKGGGLTPTRGTIYGAPVAPLAPGKHTAVAYARTGTHGTAVAWTFRV